jgi:DNA-binding response OmpR family regulator
VSATLLVVEDEPKLRELLRSYLERGGFIVLTTGSGAEALTLARRVAPDLVVLDLRLPDISGEVVANELRAFSDAPILMLTAKSSEEDRIAGLEAGADDYVVKPFSPRELVLRVEAILRRGVTGRGASHISSFGNGELVIDEDQREVQVRGGRVSLTPTEWGLLVALTGTPGRVFSRFELINRVRGYEFEGYERTVDSHVKNLRRKIERDSRRPLIVTTVLSGGYRLGISRDADEG